MKFSSNLSPQLSGKLTMIGATWFWLGFILVGLIQPNYQPIRDTISVLATGKYGWIQQLNFLILAITTFIFGFGLSKTFCNRSQSLISGLFFLLGLGIIGLIIFPANPGDAAKQVFSLNYFSSIKSLLHFVSISSMMIIMMGLGLIIFQKMNDQPDWRRLRKITFWLIGLGSIGCLIWLYGRFTGLIFSWKGLLQKILVTDVLVWLWLMGKNLTRLPEKT